MVTLVPASKVSVELLKGDAALEAVTGLPWMSHSKVITRMTKAGVV